MWDQGGQPWQQWPLNQQQWMQSFQHQQDPSQIDWAALAQAWIAQREASGQQNVVEQQGMMPNGQDISGVESGPNNHNNFQGDPNFNRMWQPEWGMPHQPPHPPPDQQWMTPTPGPMEVVPPSEDSNSQDSGEFASDNRHIFNQNNHNFGGPPDNFSMGPVNQFDYQHGAAFGPPQGGFHPPYWQPGPPGPPGPPAPTTPPQNRRERPSFRDRQRSPIAMPVKQESPQIDAVKRRTLPAWIREGLEKMEREKQKKMEKERMEQQRSQLSKKEKKESEEAEEADGPRLPQKSKFDSDEEDEDAENTERVSVGKISRSPSPIPQEEQSEPEMTEEEKEYQMMMMTKMLLTEILLDVTNEEIYYVAKDVHRKATKAPAKQLAQSSALASLTGLGGLGGYGSGDSEDERSDRGSESSDTDEEELRHRIRQKQEAFWRKEREQQLLLEKQLEGKLPSILLLYGTYLAGLTDNVSSPPVNQSLTLIVGVNLIFLAAGTVFLVHRFFHAWHNLLFGFTSGGIFVCTTTINCFIFVPQLQQWKAFEEENQTGSHMAKYFSSPSRSCHSACSAEQLCQLMGEKSSMQRLLLEKNAVIESLQEQVTNAKEKLMRLMAAECGCAPGAAAAPSAAFPSWGEQHGSAAGPPPERCPTEPGGRRPPGLLSAQWGPVPCGERERRGDAEEPHKAGGLERAASEGPACCRQLLSDVWEGTLERSPQAVPEHSPAPGTGHPLQQLPGQEASAAGGAAGPQGSGGVARVNYVSSEKLQEVLQELSLDSQVSSPASPRGTARGSQGPPRDRDGTRRAQGTYAEPRAPLSLDLPRRPRRLPLPAAPARFPASLSPRGRCAVDKAVSRARGGGGAWSHEGSPRASLEEGDGAGGTGPLSRAAPPASAAGAELCLQPAERQGRPEPGAPCLGAGQEQRGDDVPHLLPAQWDAPRAPAQPFPRSPCYYLDSDSSSSSEELFPCCHRPYCELCFQGPLDSLDSSSTDTEPGGAAGCWPEHQDRPRPIVNFKEDLKPTFV